MITGIVITLNEALNIEDCIKSMQEVCSEVIVVDSNSSDNTAEIAERLGAKVILQEYLGDGFQKNVGLKYANNDWVLSLDADERLTSEAISTIKDLKLDSTLYDAYAFRRRNHIGSRWIKRCGWYPDYCIRLYNRKQAQFSKTKQHSSVQTKKHSKIECRYYPLYISKYWSII